VLDVEHVTLGSIAGHGDQAEFSIQALRDTLTLRLLGPQGRM